MMTEISLADELKHEAYANREIISRIPNDKWNWKPHERSMTIGELASHLVELQDLVPYFIEHPVWDWDAPGNPSFEGNSKEEVLQFFDQSLPVAIDALEKATEEKMEETWIMKKGEIEVNRMPIKKLIRSYGLNHMYHHRGQLSVYLRLLDVPVPKIYGPSADEK